jgi:hypothetical protein
MTRPPGNPPTDLAHNWTCRRCGLDRELLHSKAENGHNLNLLERVCWMGRCRPMGGTES